MHLEYVVDTTWHGQICLCRKKRTYFPVNKEKPHNPHFFLVITTKVIRIKIIGRIKKGSQYHKSRS